MTYLPLSKFKYNRNGIGSKGPEEIEAEYHQRMNNPAAIVTALHPKLENVRLLSSFGTPTNASSDAFKYPIFYIETRKTNFLINQIAIQSKQLSKYLSGQLLPRVAVQSFINTLLKNEIIFTNEIEGVKTNPEEIGTIIMTMHNQPSKHDRRLESTIRMYRDSLGNKLPQIHELADFRDIYNTLLAGEIKPSDFPDGEHFRNKSVMIGNDTKVVHIPPQNEDGINRALTELIAYMNDDTLIPIEKALVSHFMFENTHPFIDGNGRTGRYLLSAYLSNKLDQLTGLSVSTTIHNHLQGYYKLFSEADELENRAELTFFIEGMLQIISDGQMDILNELNSQRTQLHATFDHFKKTHADLTELQKEIVYLYIQSALFTQSNTYALQDREVESILHTPDQSVVQIKRDIQTLTDLQIIHLIKRRPLQHVINPDLLNL
ncbi:Fic family protein [Lacticaseibacillus pabuli]|uniref:Fic family protein n=1 Tax=Lacticaseibacillus pabuli TaxID=3025672 RepID=A0ABY7WQG1_9LACO|nr:Fic family protein [Lacticaseibacillus sp. KACC 23028]WDF82422.1 Fic family protein [Lacticaseibacillus sp. KACC 23028]